MQSAHSALIEDIEFAKLFSHLVGKHASNIFFGSNAEDAQ